MPPRTACRRHSLRSRRAWQLVVAMLGVGATLAACSVFRSKPEPTPAMDVGSVPGSVSTEVVPAGPTRDLTPTAGMEPGTATPTRQPPPIPRVAPSPTAAQPLLTVDVPEPGQSVYSPVYVRGSGTVPFERVIEVQILGVDGEILGRAPVLFDSVTPFGEKAVYEGTLPFRQPAEQQLGSVRVLMHNPRDDSIVDYAQVLVVLLPAGSGPTDIAIEAPAAGTTIGNPVHVEGTALAPQNQITVRLKSGPAVLAARTVPLAGEVGQPGRFSVDLSYEPFSASVSSRPGYPAPSENAAGQIEVFYRSSRDGRIAQIASVPVMIPAGQ